MGWLMSLDLTSYHSTRWLTISLKEISCLLTPKEHGGLSRPHRARNAVEKSPCFIQMYVFINVCVHSFSSPRYLRRWQSGVITSPARGTAQHSCCLRAAELGPSWGQATMAGPHNLGPSHHPNQARLGQTRQGSGLYTIYDFFFSINMDF